MKRTIYILFLFFHFHLSAQDILHIESIPSHISFLEPGPGVILDKGWKWQEGDNMEWRKPDFNDSSWPSVNPLLSVHHSLPEIPKTSIFWLRLHFSIDSNIQRKQLALLIQQSGASEIYLNGELIKKLGIVDTNAAKVKAYDPIFNPFVIPINKDPQQVLAVRYTLEKKMLYTTAFRATTNPLLIAKVQYAQVAIDNYGNNWTTLSSYYFFIIGFFLILALIHLGYYFFQHGQRANLYFALYALCYIAYVLCSALTDLHSVRSKYYSLTIGLLLIIIVGLLLVTAIYKLLNEKEDWVYKGLVITAIASPFFYFLQYDWGWHIGADATSLLTQLAIMRIVLKAVRQKKKGAWLLAGGALSFLVTFILFILLGFLLPEELFLINILYAISVLSIPIATSIYLGFEFGFISIALKEKLNEVNLLSKKNIEQEKEKQQILAAQNETLEKQVQERTEELSSSLKELKATQSQLIQSEKMASLGELTAGIAHEIQNPLNFVNNFSDVNKELLAELKEEMDKGNIDEAKGIANDVIDNEEKINHHGKRADSIVKGMLQHSRTNTGQRELTDINALADEYLRLSYHGLRAKDKSFNATLETDFDPTIEKINIIPQDIGRALLNLYNNAFYAVNEKKKRQGETYEPVVSVKTNKIDSKIQIIVKDNGNGIPQSIVDKIFQPFFTTKPTGQGTGLGLSLSYDIITQGHSGTLKVETKEGQGSEFIISLPLMQNV